MSSRFGGVFGNRRRGNSFKTRAKRRGKEVGILPDLHGKLRGDLSYMSFLIHGDESLLSSALNKKRAEIRRQEKMKDLEDFCKEALEFGIEEGLIR